MAQSKVQYLGPFQTIIIRQTICAYAVDFNCTDFLTSVYSRHASTQHGTRIRRWLCRQMPDSLAQHSFG